MDIISEFENGDVIARIDGFDMPLHNAAPDLLDALIKARMWVGQYNNMPGHDAASVAMCNVIDQAITRAKGN